MCLVIGLLALAGATTAHALTYLLVHGFRHGTEVIVVHGFRPGLAAGLLSLSVFALIFRARTPGPDAGTNVLAVLPWQVGAYAALLGVEWLDAGVATTSVLHDPWLWLGTAVNGLVFVVLAGLSRVVESATASWGSSQPVPASRVTRWQPVPAVAPASAGVTSNGGCRAPPA